MSTNTLPKVIIVFFALSFAMVSVNLFAEESRLSLGLQYQTVENYFNQPPSSGYGEEAITAYGIKLEAIKSFSKSDNMAFYYGGGIGLLKGSYTVQTAGPTNGSGALDFGTNLSAFVEGQYAVSADLKIVARGGFAGNFYFLSAADYSTAPTFNPYDESVAEGSTEFFSALGLQYSADKNHPVKLLYRFTLGDYLSAWTDTVYSSQGDPVANTYIVSSLEISYGF